MFILLWKFWQALSAAYTIIICLFLLPWRSGRGCRLKAFSLLAVGPLTQRIYFNQSHHVTGILLSATVIRWFVWEHSCDPVLDKGKNWEYCWRCLGSPFSPDSKGRRSRGPKKFLFLLGFRGEEVVWQPGSESWELSVGPEELPPWRDLWRTLPLPRYWIS